MIIENLFSLQTNFWSCTFHIDVHDGLSWDSIPDVNDRGGVDDHWGALTGPLQALLIQNVSFQQGQLDLALEFCVNRRQVTGKLSESESFLIKVAFYLGLQGQVDWGEGETGRRGEQPMEGEGQQGHSNQNVQHFLRNSKHLFPSHLLPKNIKKRVWAMRSHDCLEHEIDRDSCGMCKIH